MRIYLYSTLKDLEPERRAVKDALSGLYVHTVVESYGANENSVRDTCLGDVRKCDLYVGIVALRYGFIPPGETKSITELEFEAATNAGITRLVFLKDSKAVSTEYSDADTGENRPELIRGFRERLESGASDMPTPDIFLFAADLGTKLLGALLRLQDGQTVPGPPEPTGENAGSLSPDDLPALGEDATELQQMLARHLAEHWLKICRDPVFLKAELLAECPKPLAPRAVFDAVLAGDAEDILYGLRPCFAGPEDKRKTGMGTGGSEALSQALTLLALVAAEKMVLARQAEHPAFGGHAREAFPGEEPLSAILAAAVLRFGLHFKQGSRRPANVLFDPPLAEPGNPGEEGSGLYRRELVDLANRHEMGRKLDTKGMEKASDRAMRKLLQRLEKQFGCALAVAPEAAGAMADEAARSKLAQEMDGLGVRVFFRLISQDKLSKDVEELLGDLKLYLAPLFYPEAEDPPAASPGSAP
jgi:hypothetical protein